mgnify:CR=1 FL=1
MQGLAGFAAIGPPALEDIVGQRAFFQVSVVDIGDFQFAPAGRPEADLVRGVLPRDATCIYIRQPAPLGLGHAVLCALPAVGDEPFFVHAASLEAAEAMLMASEVDAMFGWAETGIGKTPLAGSGTLQRLAQAGSDEARFGIVWSSDLLRYGPHAISKDLDPTVRRRLVPFLSGLKDSDPDLFEALARHQLGGFVSVDQTDYATVVDLVREASGAGQ